MARSTPRVDGTVLVGVAAASSIAVGSPAWFAWLEQASLFAFRSGADGFTARREGRARGGGYWRAYRTVASRQRRAYLGRATDLTIERLRAVAIQLAGDAPEPTAGQATPAAPARSNTPASGTAPAANARAGRLLAKAATRRAGMERRSVGADARTSVIHRIQEWIANTTLYMPLIIR